jgi:5-methylcytosine-specific restriction endonuclease McrA
LGKKNGGIAMLRSLWEEQQGKCAVTGEKLVPGVNASLDHIQPLSRGGTSERSNLRWVTSTVNHMKWNLTDTEFVDKCRQIAQRADYAGKVSARMHIARSN